jgi:hypothetical protein
MQRNRFQDRNKILVYLEYLIMDRPPPYFPQNQLSPASDKRYKKFKLFVASVIFGLILLLVGAGFGIYYLVNWAIS